MKDKKITILVNTSDSFEDCWNPFFSLFKKYFKDLDYNILLNTEFKDYTFQDLKIKCSKVHIGTKDRRLTWSECLRKALEQIDTPLVLYMQEDYFLHNYVDLERLETYTELMIENKQISHIGLTKFGSYGPFEKSSYLDLLEIGLNNRYRISTQAGLWRVDILKSYIKDHESGWMFEILGTLRAKKRKNEVFLTVQRSDESKGVFDYILTGIIKGKWHYQVPDLFKRHGIEVDYTKRGFYSKRFGYWQEKVSLYYKLFSNPKLILKSLSEKEC